MYNVRVLKYPSGWQYRVYDTVVGFHGNDTVKDRDSGIREVLAWNPDIGDYETVICDPDTMWTNVFTGRYEKAPTEMKEPDPERSARVSMNRTVTKVYHLARSNVWDWFFTLTFDPAKVDSFDYEQCVKSLKSWLDTIRRFSPDMRYLMVPEKHESGRYHFHGLFAGCENIAFVESGHYTKSGDTIYNVGNYKLGWSTATRVKDNSRVVKYISKYITKDLCAVSSGRKRYWASRNLDDVQAEDMLLDSEHLRRFVQALEKSCLHKSVVDGDIVKTTYYEMEVPGFEDGQLVSALFTV